MPARTHPYPRVNLESHCLQCNRRVGIAQPFAHGHPPPVPNGLGCDEWVSTAGPVRSFWVEVVSGAALQGQLYMAR